MIEPLPLEDAPPRRPRRRIWRTLVLVAACLALAAGTFAYVRYSKCAVPTFGFRGFDAPDGSCRVTLIGEPVETAADVPSGFPVIRGGRQFTATHWSTPVRTSLRWYDLDAEFVAMLRSDDVIADEVKRREKELNATVEKEGAVKWNEFHGREVQFVSGGTRTVERYLFVNKGPRPRLYVIGIGGPGLAGDAEAVHRVLGSFQLN